MNYNNHKPAGCNNFNGSYIYQQNSYPFSYLQPNQYHDVNQQSNFENHYQWPNNNNQFTSHQNFNYIQNSGFQPQQPQLQPTPYTPFVNQPMWHNLSNNNYHQFNNRNEHQNRNYMRQNNFNKKKHQNENANDNKKLKIDKRDLPENNIFFCEACDRGFKIEEKYREHCSTHKICGIDGCKFEAASKLVEIHYRNFHVSGLYKKVSSLESQNEIQKYIDERKRNFPTKSNQEKKVKIVEEKLERRELLENKEFRKDYRGKNKKRLNRKQKQNKFKNNSDQTCTANEKASLNQNNNQIFSNNKQQSYHKKPSLLEQLLAPEIRNERNILLQCINYIVNKNFFDK